MATATALALHGAALALLTFRLARTPASPPDAPGSLVQTEIVADQAIPQPVIPPRAGQVIESPGAAPDEPPSSDTQRIAERNANADRETRRPAGAPDPGQRSEARRSTRAAAAPRAAAPSADSPGGVSIAAPDAGAAAQASTDAGSSTTTAADPGGAAAGITAAHAEHADDELAGVPLGEQTRLRAHASGYAAFMNGVRDRIRRVWRVREAYQKADPQHRFKGDLLVTELAVRLAADGTVARAQVQKGSGLAAVDQEAAEALRRAGPFPVPAGIADPDGSFSFVFSFTFDLSPLRFMTATRQVVLDRWRPSRAFRQVGDRDRVTAVRLLLKRDGGVVHISPVASAGIDFLDAGVLEALKPGDRLPAPPDSLVRSPGALIPIWIEFQHRVGGPGDVRVLRRYQPGGGN